MSAMLSLEVFDPVDPGVAVKEKALEVIEKIPSLPSPTFVREFKGFEEIRRMAKGIDVDNLVVIGNGGSITSFSAYYEALVRYTKDRPKEIFVLNNMEPDILAHIKRRYPPKRTLVIPISKSGNTVGVLECMMALSDYPMFTITVNGKGTLSQMTQKMSWPTLAIPDDIGGRFSGRTHTGYFPAYLAGMDVEGIEAGARELTEFYLKNVDMELNLPLQLAYHHYLLEQAGYPQVYLSIYSQRLFGFYPLIIQLIHETYGKDGKGMTVFGGQGPEAQHHTNQRFFGGRKDVHGLFVTVDEQDVRLEVAVPDNVKDLKLDNADLGILNKMELGLSMRYESQGVIDTTRAQGIPFAHLRVSRITPQTVGEILVFFHFYVYYSALFRGVNPFDQPAVEDSKKLSFSMRKKRSNS
jgi:glucose-6-phosphate isomerase